MVKVEMRAEERAERAEELPPPYCLRPNPRNPRNEIPQLSKLSRVVLDNLIIRNCRRGWWVERRKEKDAKK